MHELISLKPLACSLPQLMSELVRKAEGDIDALRARLAAIGTAPLASTATSQSAMLLQVTEACCQHEQIVDHASASACVVTPLLPATPPTAHSRLPASSLSSPQCLSAAWQLDALE